MSPADEHSPLLTVQELACRERSARAAHSDVPGTDEDRDVVRAGGRRRSEIGAARNGSGADGNEKNRRSHRDLATSSSTNAGRRRANDMRWAIAISYSSFDDRLAVSAYAASRMS